MCVGIIYPHPPHASPLATRASSSVKNIVGQEPNQLLSSGVDDAMPQKEEANVIDKSSAAPRADAHIDGGAPALRLDVRSMGSSSESLDKGRLFSKSSRAWRKLPLVKKLLGKEGKVNCIGDWRKEEEVSHSFIFLDNINHYLFVQLCLLLCKYFQVQRLLDKLVPAGEMQVQDRVDLISQELQHHCVKAAEKGKIVNSLRLELQLRNNRRAVELETFEVAVVDKSPLDEFLPFWTAEESPYKLI